MSSGLMSCVRENSPPLELDANESGALSLPENALSGTVMLPPNSPGAKSVNYETTSTTTAPTAEQQKRRRFHTLRNLRRIFRRRTITSASAAPSSSAGAHIDLPTISTASEKNLRSATLSSISSGISASSSPSSPLVNQTETEALYLGSQSLPKSKVTSLAVDNNSKAHRNALLAAVANQRNNDTDMYTYSGGGGVGGVGGGGSGGGGGATSYYHRQHASYMSSTSRSASGSSSSGATPSSSELFSQSSHSGYSNANTSSSSNNNFHNIRQPMGVAVLPSAFNAGMSRSFYGTERQKLKSSGDSSQELDSANSSLSNSHRGTGNECSSSNNTGNEITDSQRSLSEGRLMDSDYSRDGLSQSHDSVFSESATASSLSIVLKAELADVLRKRRHRPDASDEDLGLPRSPVSPQRRATATTTNGEGSGKTAKAASTPTKVGGNQMDVSSLSLLSMNSSNNSTGDIGDGELLATSTVNSSSMLTEMAVQDRNSINTTMTTSRYSSRSTTSITSTDILRRSEPIARRDEIDLFSSDWQRLSHSAAKHKMAVRPTKKKGPSRQHRRTLENTIPEANEELFKINGNQLLNVIDKDAKSKTRSLPPGVNIKILEKQNELKPTFTASVMPTNITSAATTTTKSNTTTAATSSTTNINQPANVSSKQTITATSNSIFDLRALSAKATSIFDSKSESEEYPEAQTEIEASETGFLRRLIQRNSKRSISKATGVDDEPDNQTEPKKSLQVSDSKEIKQEISKDSKREIVSELKTVPAMAAKSSSSTITSIFSKEAVAQKPKSGPAARQRYLPQEITVIENWEKLPNATKSISRESTTSSVLTKSSHNEEIFQSTSLIREITASQTSAASHKQDHHFEKKQKFSGPSAFQQRISKSNDSFATKASNATSNTSTNSLETTGEVTIFQNLEQKQRKSVEKSRSFRTYNESKESSSTAVHSNMPSLPDLSLNLRVPSLMTSSYDGVEKEYYDTSSPPSDSNDKGAPMSLGFEINDNNLLMRPAPRAESAGSLSPLNSTGSGTKNHFILTTRTTTPKKLLTTQTVPPMPSLSPSNSCSNDIDEIEQNIDMLVKSPFVSVLRKSTVTISTGSPTKDNSKEEIWTNKDVSTTSSGTNKAYVQEKIGHENQTKRPKTATESQSVRIPAIGIVPLRESPNKNVDERKSIGTANPASCASKTTPNSFSRTRRSSSVIENSNSDLSSSSTSSSTAAAPVSNGLPEFMKIQLNRVDPCTRSAKGTILLLTNNVKEKSTNSGSSSVFNSNANSTDDLSSRRYSNESVEITETSTDTLPEKTTSIDVFEAINKQPKTLCTSSEQQQPTPKSPQRKVATKVSTTPLLLSPTGKLTTPPTMLEFEEKELVLLRPKPLRLHSETPSTSISAVSLQQQHHLSLQERKRLFMSDDKAKTDKKIEELKNERKKSITEEVLRPKSLLVKADILDTYSGSVALSDLKSPEHKSTESTAAEKETIVILRKKSFGAPQQTNLLNNTNGSIGGSCSVRKKDDATPELMKVFARRSLKIKDEDLAQLTEKILAPIQVTQKKYCTSGISGLQQQQQQQSNVDSDKENHSSSEEKLDRLSKFEVNMIEQVNGNNTNNSSVNNMISTTVTSNRNSLVDFRKNGNTSIRNGNSSNNNSINSNSNINGNAATSPTTYSGSKSFTTPSMRAGGFRTVSIDRNSTNVNKLHATATTTNGDTVINNNNINSSSNIKSSTERQTLSMRTTESVSNAVISSNHHHQNTSNNNNNKNINKTIERSATVGEFKGIHQRRAEWEQRAKEALK